MGIVVSPNKRALKCIITFDTAELQMKTVDAVQEAFDMMLSDYGFKSEYYIDNPESTDPLIVFHWKPKTEADKPKQESTKKEMGDLVKEENKGIDAEKQQDDIAEKQTKGTSVLMGLLSKK